MAVTNSKFSEFVNGGDLAVDDIVVGLRAGLHTRFTYTGELPPGVIVPVANGGTGLNAAVASATLVSTNAAAPIWTASMTDGQIVIGFTGGTPVAATLTAGTGMSITNAAGSITLSAAGGAYSWNEITTTSATMVASNGYIANNASLVTLTLPATSSVGDSIYVAGKGAGLFKVAQNAGQSISISGSTTTPGVLGSLTIVNQYDSFQLLCITANTGWMVLSGPQGALTIV